MSDKLETKKQEKPKKYTGDVVVEFKTTKKTYSVGSKYETDCEFSFNHLKNNKKYIK